MSPPSAAINANNLDQELSDIAKAFKDNIKLEDRKYRLTTYKNCFVGNDAVDHLISSGQAPSRADAVALGQALQATYLFEHVTRDHQFKDERLFYRFLDEKERGTYKIDAATGQAVNWSNFLAPASAHGEDASDSSSLQPSLPQPDLEALSSNDVHVASKVWPLDENNIALLNNVHPPEWQDPVSKKNDNQYDLVVIGGGTAGLISAAGSAGVGARVAMIEEHMLGGDCLNVGCVPSKAIIHSANLAHTIRGDMAHLNNAGIFVDPSAVRVDFERVMERIREVRSKISHHDSAERYSKELGVEIFIGRGKFTSERTIEVNGRTLQFKRAAIATGGYPTLIPMPGLKELYDQSTKPATEAQPRPIIMTNETIFNMTKQPKNMVVIGAGVIGMELAQAMQRLGTAVSVMGRSGKVLPKEDEDMADIVKQQMIKDGVTFRLGVEKYTKIELTGKVLDNGYPEMKMTILEKGATSGSTEIFFDALLVAAGRRPNVTGMDLELAKVEYDTKKGILVNDKLQTSNSRVYGVGDCCSDFKFTHAADFMARAFIRNALFFGKEKMSNLLIPYATFTSPEIASVGLYGKDLDERGIEYKIIEKHFKDNDRAILDDKTDGFVRFRVDSKGTILGASIVGEGAGNMISEVTLAMQSKTSIGALAAVIHPYPTTAEVLRQSGDIYNKTRLTTTVKTLLRGIVKLQF